MFLWRRKTTAARRRYTLQKQKKKNLYSPELEFLQDSWKVLYLKSHGSILNTSHLKGLDQLGDRRGKKKRRQLFVEDSEKLLQNSKQPQQQQKRQCEYHSSCLSLNKKNNNTQKTFSPLSAGFVSFAHGSVIHNNHPQVWHL